ncbi:hypothetical protein EVG20_g7840 [Dentipellis fragilis]|uniref:Glycosyl transferase family 25 domain-containing protein n=1 Tax=Dentipellis fragilis TaxID=205917 RepID=A0A4Y9YCW8_9AGAM|nr:hypothetical protein EVG20_g7840 [Dentipellis fragilis]
MPSHDAQASHLLSSRRTVALAIAISLTILSTFHLLSEAPLAFCLGLVAPFWPENATQGTIGSAANELVPSSANRSRTLGVASRIYVVSLPARTDRREQMDRLRASLDLEWAYVDAVDASHPEVFAILRQVRALREQIASVVLSRSDDPNPLAEPSEQIGMQHAPVFHWPDTMDELVQAPGPLQPSGADLWTVPSEPQFFDNSELPIVAELHPAHRLQSHSKAHAKKLNLNLACTHENRLLASFSASLPPQRILTPAKVACWHSHMQVIREIANSEDERPAIILEDDVDMEWDIQSRLEALWPALPVDWDIVYLGHCWSDESLNAALRTTSPPPSPDLASNLHPTHSSRSSLHPSVAPKCTHAYVLSRSGARRVLLHLRHPPFAYSRAIDQALAWLVRSGRVRAFSVVRSVVVQRKKVASDVMSGKGSKWREGLVDGVLAAEEMRETDYP